MGSFLSQQAKLASLRKAWRDSGKAMRLGEATLEQERELFAARAASEPQA